MTYQALCGSKHKTEIISQYPDDSLPGLPFVSGSNQVIDVINPLMVAQPAVGIIGRRDIILIAEAVVQQPPELLNDSSVKRFQLIRGSSGKTAYLRIPKALHIIVSDETGLAFVESV